MLECKLLHASQGFAKISLRQLITSVTEIGEPVPQDNNQFSILVFQGAFLKNSCPAADVVVLWLSRARSSPKVSPAFLLASPSPTTGVPTHSLCCEGLRRQKFTVKRKGSPASMQTRQVATTMRCVGRYAKNPIFVAYHQSTASSTEPEAWRHS